ncbi:redox-sensing transcriptional repressor Rex [Citricoccus sp. SGAir0253]|uniref:redox-sensing transcriptional repressor Rex n=1 Tax=Citricoccus sp. SGAir0253 TaxID=2567881 RepID=UPI0010CCD9DF|nr:redox-sensing transcriptional repressor Rex [Citricoccus sp. SGAir0253]QCU77361.1 redox-sensing transcriptional repressor Rex [Citricoccus sp. SGAir0253]
MSAGPPPGSGLSRRTVARLPVYLRALAALAADGITRVSSTGLAERTGVGPPLVRRDLAGLGQLGRRGVGYPVAALQQAISRALGLAEDQPVVLVGAGHLGSALAGYDGFAGRGLRICAVLDADRRVIGERRGPIAVRAVDDLEDVVAETGARLAILAVPAATAQAMADRLVAAGIQGLLNFAPVELAVPARVAVRAVDLSTELQILAFHQAELSSDRPGRGPAPAARP